jgi:gluconolactonase
MPPWITVHDERFKRLCLPNAPLATLGEGYGWLEGPVWFADANQLLVSDIPNDRIMRWSEHGGMSVFRQPSNFANGQTRDRQGRLLTCSHRGRCIYRTEWDGTITVLASHYDGKQLNSPNDIVCSSDGTIWFSDPPYGSNTDYEGGKHAAELPPTLYKLDPAGKLSIASDTIVGPNGLCFSPDERLLYVADSGEQFGDGADRHIKAFDVIEGRLHGGRLFHTVSPGFADGMCCDEDGRVWSSAADGVHCIEPDGTHIGTILTGDTVANLCFGGRNYAQLFICASHRLMTVFTNVRGAQRP